MPRRDDIRSVCVLGAGPIRIGQACEFDYSGVQGVQALREEGLRVVLVNSNPATIMTDPERADATYVEPITARGRRPRSSRRRGATRCCRRWAGRPRSTWRSSSPTPACSTRLGVRLLGRQRGRDPDRRGPRALPRGDAPGRPPGAAVRDRDLARARRRRPPRPSASRRSCGPRSRSAAPAPRWSTTARSTRRAIKAALAASPVGEVLVERSVEGWKEFELEVMRDVADTVVVVCSIENVDAMGVHTGDSITVAPALTLTDKEYQVLRDAAATCLRTVGRRDRRRQRAVRRPPRDRRVGDHRDEPARLALLGARVQGDRASRSRASPPSSRSATASTRSPTRSPARRPASFEPALDYVVVKIPRFAFEKFPGAEDTLGTSMKSVGEVMAIGDRLRGGAAQGGALARAGARRASPRRRPVAGLDDEALASRRAHRPTRTGCGRWPRRCGAAGTSSAVAASRAGTRGSCGAIAGPRGGRGGDRRAWLRRRRALAAAKRLGFGDADLARLVGRPEARCASGGARRGRGAPLPQGGHLRRRVRRRHARTSTAASAPSTRCRRAQAAGGRDPGLRPGAHRAGDRVRRLLRAGDRRAARARGARRS